MTTPTDYAAEELALWELALREQQQAEAELHSLRNAWSYRRMRHLETQVDDLRTRADLLLAQAVDMKCSFRDLSLKAGPSSSQDEATGGPNA